jgi:hypothetical protein
MKDKIKKLFRFIFIYYILGSFAIIYVLYDIPDWGEALATIYFAISLFTFHWFFSELGEFIESYEYLEQYVKRDIKKRNERENEKN